MDPASPRLREIIDRLLASPFVDARDRALIEEAKAILVAQAAPTITVRHDPSTRAEPAVLTLRMPGVER